MLASNRTASSRHRLTRTTIALLICVVGALAVTACGSSSSSTTTTSTSATSSTGASGRTPAGSAQRRAALTACLQKAGIKLPARPAGSSNAGPGTATRPRTGGLFGGGGRGPYGNPTVRAALQKCGLSFGRRLGGGRRVNNAAYRTAVTNYVACVRKHGYTLPKPNFSGKAPVFNASQVNRNDPKFKAASGRCQQLLNLGQAARGGG